MVTQTIDATRCQSNGAAIVPSALSDTQEVALALVPLVPAVLSFVGSSLIIQLVVRAKFRSTYKRILFALSVSDIFNAITCILQPFLVPRASSRRLYAMGGDPSCQMLGFLFQLSHSAAFYSCALTFYFVLTIRYGLPEETLARKVEPVMHVLSGLFPFVSACVGVTVITFTEADFGLGCWANSNSAAVYAYGWAVSGAPAFFVLAAVLLNNVLIFGHVRRTTLKVTQTATTVSAAQARRVQAVAVQSFLYIISFWITWVWAVVLRVLESQNFCTREESRLFPILVLFSFFTPLQGFLNFFIYLRPRYLGLRSRMGPNTSTSRWRTLQAAYFDQDSVPSANRSRSIHRTNSLFWTMGFSRSVYLGRSNHSQEGVSGSNSLGLSDMRENVLADESAPMSTPGMIEAKESAPNVPDVIHAVDGHSQEDSSASDSSGLDLAVSGPDRIGPERSDRSIISP